ncbi:hypothetical protein PRK78_006886 [Emydomyces testavorans]|uniref:Phospholipase/carboxylesterase/thioesterase domain-containing protein n=1 Tax=Emydomyces testavorans TaxID=2070801 RepID=A0AAF0DM81_9EURO|nr:hypothetical protein PRK78_006886 [Emydomyces testavorans]
MASQKPYPALLVVPPLQSNSHTHTLILLHGLGSNAERFGPELLESSNLPAQLPTVKFVFPTAIKQRSTFLKRIPVNQWFNFSSLDDPNERTELQIDGLCQTAAFLRKTVEHEAALLGTGGYQRVVLGGLSQGCAASVFALLGGGFGASGNEKLGGFIGMSGWLPFERQLRLLLDSRESTDDDNDPFSTEEADPFAQSSDRDDTTGDERENIPELDVLNYIRDVLDLPMLTSQDVHSDHLEDKLSSMALSSKIPVADYLQVPTFIGHGSLDLKVPVQLGEKLADFLSSALHMDVTWKAYKELGHWYSVPEEIDDIIHFLQDKVKVPITH